MTSLSAWLHELDGAARDAERSEEALRAEFARRVAALADERACAYRRANLMRAVAQSVVACEDQETATAHGLAALRARLGWSSGNEAHEEIVNRFAPVCVSLHTANATDEPADPGGELGAFERWFQDNRGSSFWALFESHMPETPRVDY
jgi:hypothetical protein